MSQRTLLLLRRALHYKSFILGVAILLFFIGLSVYAEVTWPFEEAITLWNNPEAWLEYPKFAKPEWITVFTGKRELRGSLILDSRVANLTECVVEVRENKSLIMCKDLYKMREIRSIGNQQILSGITEITFNYEYDEFPSGGKYEVYVNSTEKVYVDLVLVKPNGLEVKLEGGFYTTGAILRTLEVKPGELSRIQLNYAETIKKTYGVEIDVSKIEPVKLLFIDDKLFIEKNIYKPLNGTYRLISSIYSADINATAEVKVLIHGTIYGIAGTDRLGRDLFMAIAWGAPIAIAFGLTASVLSTLLTMILAAISAWYGKIIDNTMARINEIFMIIPFLPTIIMLRLFYGLDLWGMLWIIILFSVWGSGLKTMRAMFLQIREMPYIEAARAYGASSARIIARYMVPRVVPVLIPNIVTAIPSFVFLEAALAILGVSDPRLITWGKVLQDAYENAALTQGHYHWILGPAIALFLMAIAFALIGFTLDRVFNPRLREL